ncbi:hypothetical protein SAMD00019534_113340 [Acytostelium subglobosum LB1]|uniref:hypothetical protein n=1 Tax=Acytostelium subglobosum LB1 TaxID=1410327 RepID=UPI000644D9CD|nr:hypothetical protein SAMD00019534_113340 [Acytostelium subglobosum LB1]GAM28158.1 hypothetical protein SAMD00019534_113340 [Acytostelium subglobosum LB1]|eukprot:XP_012748792.1 hypothetical protein SAMD00019534_113340 [Acytostelium subglobosum LB1]
MVIKGKTLLANGDLKQMIRYHANQYFIKEYDRVCGHYPYNDTLLGLAIKYNNRTIFNHLLNNTNMSLPIDNNKITKEILSLYNKNESSRDLTHSLLRYIVNNGNYDMLVAYIEMTAHQSFAISESQLCRAIAHGNVSLVRLLLKHTNICSSEKWSYFLEIRSSSTTDINLDMLTMLHEEFGYLDRPVLWSSLFVHATIHNQVSCVMYILELIPNEVTTERLIECMAYVMAKCMGSNAFPIIVNRLKRHKSHVTFFKQLCKNRMVLGWALSNGRLDMVNFILGELDGDMHVQEVDSIHKSLATSDELFKRLEQHRLVLLNVAPLSTKQSNLINYTLESKSILMNAIYNDDIDQVTRILERIKHSSTTKITLGDGESERLWHRMSQSLGKHLGSQDQIPFDLSDKDFKAIIDSIGEENSRMSEDVAKLFISKHITVRSWAIKEYGMIQSARISISFMEMIKSLYTLEYGRDCLAMAIQHGCKETIPHLVQYIGEGVPKHNLKVLEAIGQVLSKGSLADVKYLFEHLPEKFIKQLLFYINAIENTIEVFEFVLETWYSLEMDGQAWQQLIDEAYIKNSVHVVQWMNHHHPSYLPNTRTLQIAASKNAFGSLQYYYDHQAPSLNLPTHHLLRSLHSIMNVAYTHGHTRIIHLCHSNIIILEKINKHVLGVPAICSIKGGELLSRHSLRQYLKYGATDFFNKSFQTVSESYPFNTQLLIDSMYLYDMRATDNILGNHQMSPRYDDGSHIYVMKFIVEFLSCSHPLEWKRRLEFFAITFPTYLNVDSILSIANCPTTLQQLHQISIDAGLGTIMVDSDFPRWEKSNQALDFLKAFHKLSMAGNLFWITALNQAVRSNLLLIVRYILDNIIDINDAPPANHSRTGDICTKFDGAPDGGPLSTALFKRCGASGSLQMLDLLLTYVPGQSLVDAYQQASLHGHINLVKTLYNKIKQQVPPVNHEFSHRNLNGVLKHGQLGVAHFMLDTPFDIENGEPMLEISDIHPDILSTGLLMRLINNVQLRCRFNNVMGSAIQSHKQDCIDLLIDLRSRGHPILFDRLSTLEAAEKVGDIITPGRVLHYTDGKLFMRIAAANSLELIKQVHQLYPNDVANFLEVGINACAIRGDLESMEYLHSLRGDQRTSGWDCQSRDPATMSFLIDNGYTSHEGNLLDNACKRGDLQIVQVLHHKLKLVPSMNSLAEAAKNNHLNVINNKSLCERIFKHVSDIHVDLINNRVIKSVIKGKELLADGHLEQMLRYNATQYFINHYDQVAKDYPLNDSLLSDAIQYNNIVVFKHLLNNTNMSVLSFGTSSININLAKSGSIEMLQTYLDMTGHRPLSKVTCRNILMAVNTGNEEFVKLFLQNIVIDQESGGLNMKNKGVTTVSMIKLVYSYIGHIRVKKENATQSRYKKSPEPICLSLAIRGAATNGHIHFIKYLHQHFNGDGTLFDQSILNIALESGHLNVANLIPNELSDTPIQEVPLTVNLLPYQSFIQSYLEHPRVKWSFTMHEFDTLMIQQSLRTTVLEAISNDNIITVKDILPRCNLLDLGLDLVMDHNIWRRMSNEMGMLIASQTHQPLLLIHNDLEDMICAIGHSDSKMTELVIKTFVINNHFGAGLSKESSRTTSTALVCAAGVSLSLMQFIKEQTQALYSKNCLASAISNGIIENINFLSEPSLRTSYGYWKDDETSPLIYAVKTCLNDHPLEAARATFDTMGIDYNGRVNVKHAMDNDDKQLLRQACESNYTETIQSLYKLYNIQPSLAHLEAAASINSFKVLEFILVTWSSSNFITTLSKPDRLRTLHSILHIAYDQGYVNIIRLCNTIINDINNDKKRKQSDIDEVEHQPLLVPSSPRMDNALHTVFRDKRLCRIILAMVPYVYRAFGIKGSQLIKGGKLLAKDSLVKYIKYGATEWFIKSYNTVSNAYPHNHSLLEAAIERPDIRIFDTLLQSNYNISLTDTDNDVNEIKDIYSTIPDEMSDRWMGANTRHVLGTCRTGMTGIDGDMLTEAQHPALLIKLISISTTIPTNITPCTREGNSRILNDWINNPFAKELIQVMLQLRLISDVIWKPLLKKSINNINNIQLSLWLLDQFGPKLSKEDIILHYGALGQHELLDKSLEDIRINDVELFNDRSFMEKLYRRVNKRGHIELAKKMHRIISSMINQDQEHPPFKSYGNIGRVLEAGHLDMALYMLETGTQTTGMDMMRQGDDDGDAVGGPVIVSDIHHDILSISLLEMLHSHPDIIVNSFSSVMARAVLIGNRDIIDWLASHDTRLSWINYPLVLGTAIIAGDIITTKMVLDHPESRYYSGGLTCLQIDDLEVPFWTMVDPAVGLLLTQHPKTSSKVWISVGDIHEIIKAVGRPGSKMTEEVACYFIRSSLTQEDLDTKEIPTLLKCAASASFNVFKEVHRIFNQLPPYMYTDIMPDCIKRKDLELIEYILDIRGTKPPARTMIRKGTIQLLEPGLISLFLSTKA